MKETLKISDRFNLVKKLGQGTFSKLCKRVNNESNYLHFRLYIRSLR